MYFSLSSRKSYRPSTTNCQCGRFLTTHGTTEESLDTPLYDSLDGQVALVTGATRGIGDGDVFLRVRQESTPDTHPAITTLGNASTPAMTITTVGTTPT